MSATSAAEEAIAWPAVHDQEHVAEAAQASEAEQEPELRRPEDDFASTDFLDFDGKPPVPVDPVHLGALEDNARLSHNRAAAGRAGRSAPTPR